MPRCSSASSAGSQKTFAAKYDNGDAIPSNLSVSEWTNTTSGAVALYSEIIDDGEGGSSCEEAGPTTTHATTHGRSTNMVACTTGTRWMTRVAFVLAAGMFLRMESGP